MTRLERLCALRDKIIMDKNYSPEEQQLAYDLLDREIHADRQGLNIVVE